ncbi:MAG: XisH family protein [Phormidesmis sp. CAN_BIN44]|nr:XisH family protein [Phormidesmis sp. CAN_BIN44]
MVGGSSLSEGTANQPTEKVVDRILYLAVPIVAYQTFFQLEFPKMMVEENQVKMIVYDVKREVIAEWKRN